MIYFLAGVLVSAITTWHVRMIASGNAYMSALTAFTTTLIGVFVVVDIVTEVQSAHGAFWYALGIAVGSFVAVRYRRKTPPNE